MDPNPIRWFQNLAISLQSFIIFLHRGRVPFPEKMGNFPTTFSGTLGFVSERLPYRQAISVRGGEELAYADLHHYVEKVASCLHDFGVRSAEVVPIVFSDTVESVVSLLAVMRIRAVALPLLGPVCTEEGFERYLNKYKVKLLVDGPEANPTAQAVASKLDATHYSVSLRKLPDHPAVAVINEPGDVALLLPTDPTAGDAAEVTQGRLASLVKSPSLIKTDPILLHLRQNRHLTSMFLLLADELIRLNMSEKGAAVRSPSINGEGNAESGSPSKMEEYRMKLSELSLILAGPLLINLIVNYLPVKPWSKTMAAFLVYLGFTLAMMGVMFNQRLSRFGRWFGAAALVLIMAGFAALVLPTFGLWKGLVAGGATLVAVVTSTVLLIWRSPLGRDLPPGERETGKVGATEKLTSRAPRQLAHSWSWRQ